MWRVKTITKGGSPAIKIVIHFQLFTTECFQKIKNIIIKKEQQIGKELKQEGEVEGGGGSPAAHIIIGIHYPNHLSLCTVPMMIIMIT